VWKDDEANVTKKRELKSRLESTHKTDKLNEINREISEVRIFCRQILALNISCAVLFSLV